MFEVLWKIHSVDTSPQLQFKNIMGVMKCTKTTINMNILQSSVKISFKLQVNNFSLCGLRFPDKKRLAFRNLVQVPKVWSVFIRASFLVHVPQVRPFIVSLCVNLRSQVIRMITSCYKMSLTYLLRLVI